MKQIINDDTFNFVLQTISMLVTPSLIVVAVICIFFFIIKALSKSKKKTKYTKTLIERAQTVTNEYYPPQIVENQTGIYKYKQRKLLTNNELVFYRALYKIASKNYYMLFIKIRLADLIEPNTNKNQWQVSFNKIKSKHVDFVLCDSITMRPLLIIELDDATHDRADRQQRDNFVDQALKSAGIPILHTRTTDKLEENIIAILSSKQPLTQKAK